MAKSVPEWLNSSLWSSFDEKRKDQFSSPSSNSNDPIHSSSAPSATSSMAATAPKIQIIENPKTQKTNFPIARTPNPPTPQSTPSTPHSAKQEQGEFPDPSFPSPEDASRRARFLMELSKKVINLGELRRLAALGIPDSDGIRPIAWKLLIGYLSCDRERWPDELHKKRRQYKVFKEELLVNPSEITRKLEKSAWRDNRGGSEGSGYLQRSEIPNGEHPLSLGKSSVWNQFFQDVEIAEQIDRDVKRTHPDLNFFSGDSQAAAMNREALKRILLIFAKLNPGIRYVQGMNEVLAPLFYIFRSDPSEDSLAHAEADTFFCFVELLSGFRDHFCQQLDNSVVGIRSTISRLSQLLKKHDEELWRHLEITTKVNPQFYAFRWITLLLTQEFNFVDCLHIWDTLLSDPDGPMESLLRICCAMLVLIRRRLLAGDFTANLKLLQHYPSQNISHLLYVADKFRAKSSQ